MSERYHIGDLASCQLVQSRVSKLLGCPTEGTDVGGGRHVEHDRGAGIGWVVHAYPVEREAVLDVDAKSGDRTFTRILDPDKEGLKESLSPIELAYLRGKWATGQAKPVKAVEGVGHGR